MAGGKGCQAGVRGDGTAHTCDPLSQDVCAALFMRGTWSGAGGGALPPPIPIPPPPPPPSLPNQSSQQRINRPKANTGPQIGHCRLWDAVKKKNSNNKNKIRGEKNPTPRGPWGCDSAEFGAIISGFRHNSQNPTMALGLAAPTPGAYRGYYTVAAGSLGVGVHWVPSLPEVGGSGRFGNPI